MIFLTSPRWRSAVRRAAWYRSWMVDSSRISAASRSDRWVPRADASSALCGVLIRDHSQVTCPAVHPATSSASVTPANPPNGCAGLAP